MSTMYKNILEIKNIRRDIVKIYSQFTDNKRWLLNICKDVQLRETKMAA